MRRCATALLLLALGACSPAGQTADEIRSRLSRAQLDTFGEPLLLAGVADLGTAATLIPAERQGGVETWETGDGVQLSFRDGVIVATRGLGFDLMSADADAAIAAIGGSGSPEYDRFASYLDGNEQVVLTALRCRITGRAADPVTIVGDTHDTIRVEEQCFTPDSDYRNLYWIDRDGTIWRSRQWIGPGAGTLTTDLLIR